MFLRNRLLFVSTLLVGACLWTLEQPAFAADRIACNLITQADVEAVFHEKFKSGGPSPNDTSLSSACAYELLGPFDVAFNLIMHKRSAAVFDTIVSVASASGMTPLTGVGEKAYENAKSGTTFVYSKGYELDFQILSELSTSRMSEARTDLERLAKRAVAHL